MLGIGPLDTGGIDAAPIVEVGSTLGTEFEASKPARPLGAGGGSSEDVPRHDCAARGSSRPHTRELSELMPPHNWKTFKGGSLFVRRWPGQESGGASDGAAAGTPTVDAETDPGADVEWAAASAGSDCGESSSLQISSANSSGSSPRWLLPGLLLCAAGKLCELAPKRAPTGIAPSPPKREKLCV